MFDGIIFLIKLILVEFLLLFHLILLLILKILLLLKEHDFIYQNNLLIMPLSIKKKYINIKIKIAYQLQS